MRIAIDARKLRDYGIGTYVRNLLKQLAQQDQATEYVVLCHDEDLSSVSRLGENFHPVAETSPGYSVREQVRVPLNVRRERAALFHAPHYVLPPLTPCRTVVTIHDCIHLRFPQYLQQPVGICLRARVAVGGNAPGSPRDYGIGSVEARHPALLSRARIADRRDLQRDRRSVLAAAGSR